MTFNGIDNQTIEFRITNYEYPDFKDGEWDGNWLNIYLNVKSSLGHWQSIGSILTTWEVQEMINWFERLSKNDCPKCSTLRFTEPNLSFELLDNQNQILKKFRIKFDLESRPKSATDDKEYFVDCIADAEELRRIASDLKIGLEKYPERNRAVNK
jgi:hypothetical protein